MGCEILLDTCTLLFILSGDKRLCGNDEVMTLLNESKRYYSPLSIAEIAINRSLGKLQIEKGYLDQIRLSGIEELNYSGEEAVILEDLPFHHKDPFDRMIISSAIFRRIPIVTADTVFKQYLPDTILI